jgi:phenylalanyl-tRNA synthetase alpha chain
METREILEQLRTEAPARIEQAGTVEELSDLAVEITGKQSPIAVGRRSLGSAPPDQRRDLGRAINDVAVELNALIETRRAALEAVEASQALEADRVDVTLPGRVPPRSKPSSTTSPR